MRTFLPLCTGVIVILVFLLLITDDTPTEILVENERGLETATSTTPIALPLAPTTTVTTTPKDTIEDTPVAEKVVVETIDKTITTPVPTETTPIITETTETAEISASEPIIGTTTIPKEEPIEEVPINEPTTSFSDLNVLTRSALVNIFCTAKSSGLFQPLSGSGIIIDPRGVILTNAHIAQYYLIKDYPTNDSLTCTIRTGSPANAAYRAELLYISPSWIEHNYERIADEQPKGTGEYDYGLLLITEVVSGSEQPLGGLPALPHIQSDAPLVLAEDVLVAGYAAGFLGGEAIQKDLYALSSVTEIVERLTYSENVIDVLSLGGTILAQQGSSGGAVVSPAGELLGMITTTSAGDTTSERDLRAITLSHINRSLKGETGSDLSEFLQGDLDAKLSFFATTNVPQLRDKLLEALP